MILNRRLEQFQIIPLLGLHIGMLDISLTNSSLSALVGMSLFLFYLNTLLNLEKNTFNFVPSRGQALFEILFQTISKIVVENVGLKGQRVFPLVMSIFLFILIFNILGLIHYSFTVTSHLIIVLTMAIIIFFGVNYICISIHKLKFFSLLFPGGTSLILGFLLVPIELISYIFKPISLAIRLFANMMAGHTLLKVVAGFSWSLVSISGFLFCLHIIPLLILISLFGLELGVALIQAYVFTLLTWVFINNLIN